MEIIVTAVLVITLLVVIIIIVVVAVVSIIAATIVFDYFVFLSIHNIHTKMISIYLL